MQKQIILSIVLFFSIVISIQSQSIGVNTNTPDTTAALDVVSTTKGMLVPRMTTGQRTLINDPATGLLVFDISTMSFWFYDGADWSDLSGGPKDKIVDGDNDTSVEVDNGSDNDEIAFILQGNEMAKMDGKTFHLGSTDGSVFIGNNAGLYDSVSNNSKVAIGQSAMMNDTAGFGNVAIGFESMRAHQTGSTNTALGYRTLQGHLSGVSNVAIGSNALISSKIGAYNTAVGADALLKNKIGQRNTAIGRASLQDNRDSLNVALGDLSGAFSAGSRNTMLGVFAGGSSAGDNNVYLGYEAGENNTGNNRLFIANSNTNDPLIYGEFDKNLLRVNGTLDIGGKYRFEPFSGNNGEVLKYTNGAAIWKSDEVDDADADPNNEIQMLDYSGGILSLNNGGGNVGINEGLWEEGNTEIFYDDGGQDVAIGTTDALGKLHIRETSAKPALRIEHAYNGASTYRGIDVSLLNNAANKTGIYVQSVGGASTSSAGINAYITAGSGTNHAAIKATTSGSATAIQGTALDASGWAADFTGFSHFDGDLGIGTESPDAKVEIEHTIAEPGLHVDHKYAGASPLTAMRIDVPESATGSKTALQVQTLAGTSTSTNGVASFLIAGPSGNHHAFISSVVGAGTAYRGFAEDAGAKVMEMFGTSEFHGRSYFDGNVGIGTESPVSSLHVHDSENRLVEMFITPQSTSSEDSSMLFFAEDHNGTFGMYWLYDGDDNEMELWGKSSNGIFGPHMRIGRDNGLITLRDDKIQFNPNAGGAGRITTDEIEITGGSDLAEYFKSSDENTEIFEPGTVVCISDNKGEIVPSNISNDTKVIGVVSGANGVKTGMFLGQKGTLANGDVPVAITGRVYVKVSRENGHIMPGDFVTTSTEAGKAMKVKSIDISKGAILGKALTKEIGGFVLVLIGLQ